MKIKIIILTLLSVLIFINSVGLAEENVKAQVHLGVFGISQEIWCDKLGKEDYGGVMLGGDFGYFINKHLVLGFQLYSASSFAYEVRVDETTTYGVVINTIEAHFKISYFPFSTGNEPNHLFFKIGLGGAYIDFSIENPEYKNTYNDIVPNYGISTIVGLGYIYFFHFLKQRATMICPYVGGGVDVSYQKYVTGSNRPKTHALIIYGTAGVIY